MPTVGSLSKRKCPTCLGPKDYYAQLCRSCRKNAGLYRGILKGATGPDHPAWKGGTRIDDEGYVKRYDPSHPWPRKGGYVAEHVRLMELQLGRRLTPDESVHHRDHNRQNNDLTNLELLSRGQHSRLHRLEDTGRRQRDASGRFAPNGGDDRCLKR